MEYSKNKSVKKLRRNSIAMPFKTFIKYRYLYGFRTDNPLSPGTG